MARGVNKVILVGNVGGDPETRYMPNGNAVTNITLATSESWKDKQTGQQQERTEWHRVVFFGLTGNAAAPTEAPAGGKGKGKGKTSPPPQPAHDDPDDIPF